MTSVRRVVTGVGANGKSQVSSDTLVAPVAAGPAPGSSWHPVAGPDSPLAQPPGVRFGLLTVPPSRLAPPCLETSATVDLVCVVSGEIWLELDDRREVHLRAGDTVVQNGVRHAWRNHSDAPCTMMMCLVGKTAG